MITRKPERLPLTRRGTKFFYRPACLASIGMNACAMKEISIVRVLLPLMPAEKTLHDANNYLAHHFLSLSRRDADHSPGRTSRTIQNTRRGTTHTVLFRGQARYQHGPTARFMPVERNRLLINNEIRIAFDD